MTFSELEYDYLIDITREQTVVNIISLLKTIELCEDVISARLEDYVYNDNDYAIRIITINPQPKNEYIIWYRYIDKIKEDVLLVGIRDDNINYSIEMRKYMKPGEYHIFSKREIEFFYNNTEE